MPSAKEKRLRKERILQFIRENRELRPINTAAVLQSASPIKEDAGRQKKRVTFTHGKQQRSFGDSPRGREVEKNFGQGLTSCLITKPSHTRLKSGVSIRIKWCYIFKNSIFLITRCQRSRRQCCGKTLSSRQQMPL